MKKLLCLLTALLLLVVCLVPAMAAGISVSLPVAVRVTGKVPATAEYVSIVLTAEDPASPMPTGSVDGTYTMRMRAGSQSAFPAIDYSWPGTYRYTVRQKRGTTPGCTYDSSLFVVDVCIAPGDDGLYPVIVVQENEGSYKLDGITFRNVYRDVTPTPVPTPQPTVTPVPNVTVTPVPGVTVTPVPDVTVTPVPDVTVTPIPGATTTPVPGVTVTPVPGVTVTPVPNVTVTPVPGVTVTPVPGVTVTPVPTPTPTPHGSTELPPTGVEDHWMLYLGGAAAFLTLAAVMVWFLLRPEKEERDE